MCYFHFLFNFFWLKEYEEKLIADGSVGHGYREENMSDNGFTWPLF